MPKGYTSYCRVTKAVRADLTLRSPLPPIIPCQPHSPCIIMHTRTHRCGFPPSLAIKDHNVEESRESPMLLLATLTTGDFFGERCILRDANEPADCSVRSVEYSDLLKLSRTTFEDLQSDMRDSDYNMFCSKLREVMEMRDKKTESARLKATRTKLGKAGKSVLAKLNVIQRIKSRRDRTSLAGGTNKASSVQPMQIMMRVASQNRDRGTAPFASPPSPEEKAAVDSYPQETKMKAVGEGGEEGFSTKNSMSSGGVT